MRTMAMSKPIFIGYYSLLHGWTPDVVLDAADESGIDIRLTRCDTSNEYIALYLHDRCDTTPFFKVAQRLIEERQAIKRTNEVFSVRKHS